MPIGSKRRSVNRAVVVIPRHIGGVAVEGVPRDQPCIEIGEEGGGASEGAQGKKPQEAEGAMSGRFHDDLAYRTGCVVVEYGFSVPCAEQVEPIARAVFPQVGENAGFGPQPSIFLAPEP